LSVFGVGRMAAKTETGSFGKGNNSGIFKLKRRERWWRGEKFVGWASMGDTLRKGSRGKRAQGCWGEGHS
jgi:hypothetical protein